MFHTWRHSKCPKKNFLWKGQGGLTFNPMHYVLVPKVRATMRTLSDNPKASNQTWAQDALSKLKMFSEDPAPGSQVQQGSSEALKDQHKFLKTYMAYRIMQDIAGPFPKFKCSHRRRANIASNKIFRQQRFHGTARQAELDRLRRML